MRMARSVLWGMVICGALYALLCAWLFVAQRSMVYFPQYTQVAAADTDFLLQRPGIALRGWRVHPAGRDPILYFGGNAERIEANRAAFAAMFPGRAIYLLAYRGYGASDGTPMSVDLKADALALFDHVQAAHPGQPVSVIGRSLGSGVASHLAGHRPVARLVLVTPFDSLSAVAASHYRIVPVRWLMRETFEPVVSLQDARMPVLIVRAGRDAVVPAARTQALRDALPRSREVVVEQATHDSVSDAPAYATALQEFLQTPIRTASRER